MKFISHRGASLDLPENTIAAFLLAKKSGFEYFETDVQLTRDDILAACHDYSLKRTAGIDVQVADLTFKELKQFNVAKYFKGYKGKLSVPSLKEVFDVLGDDAKICLEIKNEGNRYPDIHEHIMEFIEGRKMPYGSVSVSSFDYRTLEKVRDLSFEIPMGVLAKMGETQDLITKALTLKALSINIHFTDASEKMITSAHRNGLKVLAYTVNDRLLASKLEFLGIDGVFTDRVDLQKVRN